MEGETDVLQQRVQPCPFDRRGNQTLERIGREEKKGEKAQRDKSLHGQGGVQCARIDPLFQQRNGRARQRQYRNPEQHRPFMVAPCSRQFEDEGLVDMAVAGDEQYRQVGHIE